LSGILRKIALVVGFLILFHFSKILSMCLLLVLLAKKLVNLRSGKKLSFRNGGRLVITVSNTGGDTARRRLSVVTMIRGNHQYILFSRNRWGKPLLVKTRGLGSTLRLLEKVSNLADREGTSIYAFIEFPEATSASSRVMLIPTCRALTFDKARKKLDAVTSALASYLVLEGLAIEAKPTICEEGVLVASSSIL